MLEQFWEVYVSDIAASERFYCQALGLTTIRRQEDYAVLAAGPVRVHLCPADDAPDDLSPVVGRIGNGVEFCFVVSDVVGAYRRASRSGYPILEHLTDQDWGKTDFRLRDPDGAYIRITTPRSGPGLQPSEAAPPPGAPEP